MPPYRARWAALVLGLAGLPACASFVPWPPPEGTCIGTAGGGKRAPRRFRIRGRLATRAEVERLVSTSPETAAGMARAARLDTVGVVLAVTTLPAGWGATIAALVTRTPLLLLPAAAVFSAGVSGVFMMTRSDEPFRLAVQRYNERVAREGTCVLPPPAPPRDFVTVPVTGSPSRAREEDVLKPRYGPAPLAP